MTHATAFAVVASKHRLRVSWPATLLLLAVASTGVAGHPPIDHALVERLIQCTATRDELIAFDAARLAQRLSFTPSPDDAPWGGAAWILSPGLAAHGVYSQKFVMQDRRTFALKVTAERPAEAVSEAAHRIGLSRTGSLPAFPVYTKSLSGRRVYASSVDDVNTTQDFYLGCAYGRDEL